MRVASLASEGATHVTLVDALCHRQLVHLACRTTLANGFPISTKRRMASLSLVKIWKPFDASYEHHGDEPLALFSIVRTRYRSRFSLCMSHGRADRQRVSLGGHALPLMPVT